MKEVMDALHRLYSDSLYRVPENNGTSADYDLVKNQLTLSLKREEVYRKALEEITGRLTPHEDNAWIRDIARTALDEVKEVK